MKIVLKDIKISNPAQSALAEAGYKYLQDLTKVTKKEIANLHGMGPKGIRILEEELKKQKLSFKKEGIGK